uniref:Uncharacterized protein n=1 Tax=Ixodes scapularis TaxID=6945 RepID=A0A4D5RXC5_IXOSC
MRGHVHARVQVEEEVLSALCSLLPFCHCSPRTVVPDIEIHNSSGFCFSATFFFSFVFQRDLRRDEARQQRETIPSCLPVLSQ